MRNIVITAALACTLALPAIAGAQAGRPSNPPQSTADQPKPGKASGQAGAAPSATIAAPDKAFVMEAAQGGMAEVELGRLAADKASNADVKQFGQRMVDDHGKANDELKGFASQKSITLPTELDAKHKATLDRLSKLSGDAFDKAYMTEMVADHNKDVAAFTRASKTAKDPDLKAFAEKTLPTLQDHQRMSKEVAGKAVGTAGKKPGTSK